MTSNQYKYFSQKKFHGGIETRQEFIGDNQLLDARNHWAPLGEMEQRPGNVATATSAYVTGNNVTSTTVVWTDTSTALDSVISPSVVLTNVDYGDVVTYHYSAISTPQLITSMISTTATVNTVAKTRLVWQVYTSSGWRPLYVGGYYTGSTPPYTVTAYPFTVTGTGVFPSPFPTNVTSTTLTFNNGVGSLTGYFVRYFVRSATSSTAFPAFTANCVGNIDVVYTDDHFSSQTNTSAKIKFPGSYFLKYNAGNLVVQTATAPQTAGGGFSQLPQLRIHYGNTLEVPSILARGVKYNTRYGAPNLPPTVAVVPEFNTAFLAFANTVFEVPYAGPYTQTDSYTLPTAGTATGPLVAAVNIDPLIVGPISVTNPAVPYSTDLIPQLTTFPAANLIVYLNNQLFCAGIRGIGNLIRWSGSSTDGAYNVWPEDNQVTLSTAKDNSEITAIAPLGDNLVVFKKNSIWQLIDNGISDNNLPLYEPRLVVAGVGTVAHQSVQAVDGGLIFLGEDGFYRYDGTPNIKRISDPIQPYLDRINPARSPFAVATVWRSKQAYMCAVSLDSETQANDFVFVYAYDNDAWWVWDGWDAQCWLQIDGVGLQEEVHFLDSFGRAFKLGAWTQSDNGAEIDSWFLTPRFGFDDAITKTALELRVRGINNNPTVNYNVIGDDVEINVTGSATVNPLTLPITMAGVDEAQYDNDEVYGEAVYAPTRRRERKSTNRTTASWFQIRIRKMLKVFGWDLGYEPEGRR